MIVVAAASGTSVDGLDLVAVDLELAGDGVIELELLLACTTPLPRRVRDQVLAVLPPAATTAAAICALDQQVGQAAAAAVAQLLADAGDLEADLAVFSGQTVFHDVRDGRCVGTLQIGQPAWIAETTGLPVVSDLRARDVAAGGHGAPLASTFDALWLVGHTGRRAALNLGGIANVSIVGAPDEPVLAWDTGPANCLLDVAAERMTEGAQQYDADGRMARAGVVRTDMLERLLTHPHFTARPPASTGREAFSAGYLDSVLADVVPVAPDDVMATLTEFTARSVAQALSAYEVGEVVASGGGTRNPALMDALRSNLAGVPLVTSAKLGLPSESKEAVMWALLGFLTWHSLPGATAATGARDRRILGRITPGNQPLVLPPPADRAVSGLRVRTPVSGMTP